MTRRSAIREVRGRGLMIGVVLEIAVEETLAALLQEGIVAGSAGDRVLRLLPPFVISSAEVERFLGAFDAVLGRLAPR